MKKTKKRRMVWILIVLVLIPLLFYAGANVYAVASGRQDLYELTEAGELPRENDAILVLGAGVRSDGSPSMMLEDRLLTALELYESGVSGTIIVSGDHGTENYDEVNVMKRYLVEKGVPSDRIFMDHAGFSTYDSVYRARAIFGVKDLVIVTQRYHAYRALMIGRSLGIECVAVAAPILSSEAESYAKQPWYSFRETIARSKDLLLCFFHPEPTCLGEPISLAGSGDVTNDR